MKTKKFHFGGEKPIFTGSPSIVPGGFNLDVEAQNFISDLKFHLVHWLFSMSKPER